jgi:hypothetical protein
MFTRESPEFFARQQRFVFIRPGAEINPETKLPPLGDYTVVDVDDLLSIGTPMSADDDVEFEFWAVLEPGEAVPGESDE